MDDEVVRVSVWFCRPPDITQEAEGKLEEGKKQEDHDTHQGKLTSGPDSGWI